MATGGVDPRPEKSRLFLKRTNTYLDALMHAVRVIFVKELDDLLRIPSPDKPQDAVNEMTQKLYELETLIEMGVDPYQFVQTFPKKYKELYYKAVGETVEKIIKDLEPIVRELARDTNNKSAKEFLVSTFLLDLGPTKAEENAVF